MSYRIDIAKAPSTGQTVYHVHGPRGVVLVTPDRATAHAFANDTIRATVDGLRARSWRAGR